MESVVVVRSKAAVYSPKVNIVSSVGSLMAKTHIIHYQVAAPLNVTHRSDKAVAAWSVWHKHTH